MHVERQALFWLGALLVLVLMIALLRAILLPFVAGIAIAYFLSPLMDRLVAMGINRTLASALIVGLSTAVLVTAVVLLAPLVVRQAEDLAHALPGEVQRLHGLMAAWAQERLGVPMEAFEAGLARGGTALADNWSSLVAWVASSLWSGSRTLFNLLTLLLVTPLVVFYLLVDWHPMLEKIDGWLPREHAAPIRRLAADMNDAIAAFVRGQGTVCLVLGMFYAIALTALGLNYGLLIGIATGLLAFVPFIGWVLGLITATGLAIVQFWPDAARLLMVVGVFVAGQALDAGFLSPKIVGSKIGLHPVWLIFALIVLSYLLGFIGLLIAVPLAAAVGVLLRFLFGLYLESRIYHGGPRGGEPA